MASFTKEQLIKRGGDYGYVVPGTKALENAGPGPRKLMRGNAKKALIDKVMKSTLKKTTPSSKGVDEFKQKYA